MKQQEFETADFCLSSAISILLNIQPTFKVRNGKVLYVFTIPDDLYYAIKNLERRVKSRKSKIGLWDWD